jgi:homoserine O-succinyltransferase
MSEVMKFGGTSMAQIESVGRIIEAEDPAVVVVSAPGKDSSQPGLVQSDLGAEKMTDMLLAGDFEKAEARAHEVVLRAGMSSGDAAELIESMHGWLESHKGNVAAQAATGERFSAELIAKLTGRTLLDPAELVSIHKNRTPDTNATLGNIASAVRPGGRYVMSGFYGYDNESMHRGIQILDRGGSDTSGALVAAAIRLPYVNYTDVDGYYSTDPRFNPAARQINELTYEESRALALGGAKLLHPEVARIMRGSNLPTTVRNTFNTSSEGTRISNEVTTERSELLGVASRLVLALDIRRTGIDESAGVMRSVYDSLADEGLPYLLTNDGSDETTIFFDPESIPGQDVLCALAVDAVPDAEVAVSEFGLVVGVFARRMSYARSLIDVTRAAAAVDATVIPSSSLSRQSVELFTDPAKMDDVAHAVHELVGA